MPITPVYGFHFEDAEDQPGISLTGGAAGTELILAEQIEQELLLLQAGITDLDDRVTSIENDGILGWTYINHGSASGSNFLIDLTKGGAFGAGDFDLLRLHMRYDLDATVPDDGGWVGLRINSVSSDIYTHGSIGWDAEQDALPAFSFFNASSNLWRIGYGSTTSTNNLILELFHTNGDNFLGFQSESRRMSTNVNFHRKFSHWGALTSAVGAAPSTLRLSTLSGASSFSNAWYWVEGFRVP